MGNLCSRSANTVDPFSQPGRVLGSSAQASQDPNRAPVPSNVRITQGPGRTLGGSKTDSSEGVGVGDARSRAAEAAQVGLKALLPSRANLVIAIISYCLHIGDADPFDFLSFLLLFLVEI